MFLIFALSGASSALTHAPGQCEVEFMYERPEKKLQHNAKGLKSTRNLADLFLLVLPRAGPGYLLLLSSWWVMRAKQRSWYMAYCIVPAFSHLSQLWHNQTLAPKELYPWIFTKLLHAHVFLSYPVLCFTSSDDPHMHRHSPSRWCKKRQPRGRKDLGYTAWVKGRSSRYSYNIKRIFLSWLLKFIFRLHGERVSDKGAIVSRQNLLDITRYFD